MIPQPPIAPPRPTVLARHGDERVDPYYWLRDRSDPEVIAYLEAENAHTAALTAPTQQLEEKLYQEIVSRIQETDTSAPTFYKGYWYYSRTVEGLQYSISCRRPRSMDAPEQVMLDGNEMARGRAYFRVGVFDVSPDQSLLAYAADFTGSEKFTLRFRNLATGDDLDDAVEGVYYGSAWALDNRTFFYTKPDGAMRPYQVWRHQLGAPTEQDMLVLQEDDERFFLSVRLTKSERFVLLASGSKLTSEWRFLPSDEPDATPRMIAPRRQGVEYAVEHQEERFLILTNDGARDFKLMAAPITNPGVANWSPVVAERSQVRLNSMDVYRAYIVLGQRCDGLQTLEVLDCASGERDLVEQPEAAYTAYPGANPAYDSQVMRFTYTSLTTPTSAFDYDMATRRRTLVKEQPVRGGYDRSAYVTERRWASTGDGVRVPMSLVYRRGLVKDGTNPALLYGYGSYEASSDPYFSSDRLTLLDRGFVYAIAHVRGGGEMGRDWYENGKFLNKINTFTDFIASGERLFAEGYTAPARLAIRGGSAGGLLIGAVLNLRPDLCRCAVAQVPFVDVLTTMLDETLPLTTNEYEEWGNPNDPGFYQFMKRYSPYDNVKAARYPAILATAGLNDPRVSYFEPAKWVAKLRSVNRSSRPVLLKTQMGAGHAGPSGRYRAWREEAFVIAFVLSQLGVEGSGDHA